MAVSILLFSLPMCFFFDYVVPLESGVWTVGHLLKKLRIAIVTSGNLWH